MHAFPLDPRPFRLHLFPAMRTFRHNEVVPADALGAAIAIGNFDGMHRGHQAVIGEAGLIAKAIGAPWAVLTFEPHPRSVFKPDDEPFRLTPAPAKARLIAQTGVDFLIVVAFDRVFSETLAESFIADILAGRLKARHVVAGYDFAFGKGRTGDCALLLSMGQASGFDFTVVQAVKDAGGAVHSSSRVREALQAGRPREAAAILGRYFEVESEVVNGDARGRTIGFPTANLDLGAYIRPRSGVYAVRVGFVEGAAPGWHDGVANVGNRPTVSGKSVNLEVFLFDFAGDLYGQRLRVEFVDFIRPEKKFDGLASLKAQIARDCDAARTILENL